MKPLPRTLLPLLLLAVTAVLLTASPAFARRGPEVRLAFATFDPLAGEPAVPANLQSRDSRYALLQLAGPPRPDWLDGLAAAGVRFYDYLPEYTYLIRLPAAGAATVDPLPGVRWVGAYHPAYKLSPGITGGRLTLDLYPDADAAAVAAAVRRLGAVVEQVHAGERSRLLRVVAGDEQLAALAAIDEVRWLQNGPALQEYNDDARWVTQRNLRHFTPLYGHGLTGAGQVGAVADSGLAVYDFTGSATTSCFFVDDGHGGAGGAPLLPGPTHRKVISYTIPPGAGGDLVDGSGHGSHTSGSVAGDGPPWNSPSAGDGLAYEARLFFQDIGTGSPVGTINPPADFRDMYGQAYDADGDGLYQPLLDPRTHSNSYGDPTPIYSVESAQTDDFMWLQPDFLILFAIGNQGPAANTTGWPASAKNIVTVGATENGLANSENMLFQSSHGPAPLDRLKPEVSAPGDRIESALNSDPCGTTSRSGTSMATPVTHGVALQLRQYLWDGYYPSGAPNVADRHHPSAALLKALLMSSGRPLAGQHTDNGAGGAWPSNGQGWGRVTAGDLLYFQGDRRALWLHDEYALDGSAGLDLADPTRTFTLTVADGAPWGPEPLRVTLVWSDYQGAPAANGALVNDLNLTVTGPTGSVHWGNDRLSNDFVGLAELPLIIPDAVNPWEVVYLAQPAPGTYTVTVTLATMGSLPLDPLRRQGLALVVSGDLLAGPPRLALDYPVYDAQTPLTATVRLAGAALNGDPGLVEMATAVITSTTDTAGVTLLLTETAPDSAIFAGAVTLTPDAPATGQLRVAAGDTVRAVYPPPVEGGAAAWATAVIAARPTNLVNPPALADPGDVAMGDSYTLTWSPPEETAGLVAYAVQQTIDFHQPLFDDAEGAIGDNWTTGQLTAPWMKDSSYQQSGLSSFWSGRGDVLPLIDTSLTLNHDVIVPATATSARLTFYSRYFNDINDYGHVELSTDGGVSWQRLLYLYAAPRVPPADGRLQFHAVDLTPYIGQPLRLRFRYDNGIFSAAPDSPGWWLDDIAISGAAWRTMAVVDGGATSLALTGQPPGSYAHRLQAWYGDGSATAWGPAVDIEVLVPTALTGLNATAGRGGLRYWAGLALWLALSTVAFVAVFSRRLRGG